MKDLSIRPVKKEDEQVYMELIRSFYNTDAVIAPLPEEYHLRNFAESLKDGPFFKVFLLEIEGKSVGVGQISFRYGSEAGGMECWFEDLYVLKEYRSLGIGGRFIDYVKERFPANRYRLEVEDTNPRAVALYEKKGFTTLPYKQMICDLKG